MLVINIFKVSLQLMKRLKDINKCRNLFGDISDTEDICVLTYHPPLGIQSLI